VDYLPSSRLQKDAKIPLQGLGNIYNLWRYSCRYAGASFTNFRIMKNFTSYIQMSKEYFANWTKRYEKVAPVYEHHPREDYHLISNKYPIYVVADGVTLKRDTQGNYPVPSGAFELAKKFCGAVIEEAEKRYSGFTVQDLKEVFNAGNKVAREFNESQGRTKDTVDYREFDLFAVTTAFVLIKDMKMYWWSLGDSGITICDKKGEHVFQSPEAWPTEVEQIAATGNAELTDTENGDRGGYGVVTGENAASVYLNDGSMEFKENSTVFIYTDGYEDYIRIPEFISRFLVWDSDLESQVRKSEIEKNTENIKYGRERTLIVVKIWK
jgi:hypothetical protein